MNVKILAVGTTLALAGWFALASAAPLKSPSLSGYQVAENDHNERHQEGRGHDWKDRDDEWYQGQRGRWHHDNDGWQWRTAPGEGDEWYQGQRGHWYQESNGWRFGSGGMVCNDQGRHCRQGGYLPPNGAGMVNHQNPNLYWACDSDGHNCHWERRPR
jgi:hypothetical protein